jgi:hypothetical protein
MRIKQRYSRYLIQVHTQNHSQYVRIVLIILHKAFIHACKELPSQSVIFSLIHHNNSIGWSLTLIALIQLLHGKTQIYLPPFAVVVNETNTHCHIVYALAAPVCTSDLAHEKPLRYLAAIQQAYTEKLQADVNYSGLIAKNPFSQNHWHVIPCAIHAKYTLDDLAEWVSLNGC